MNRRMEGFNPAIKTFWVAGCIAYIDDFDA
jgi:hypothetical protein